MKRFAAVILLTLVCTLSVSAAHIKGGEIYYTYIGEGASPNTSVYRVSLKLYIDCGATSPGQLDPSVNLSIFNAGSNTFVENHVAQMDNESFIRFDSRTNPCIGNPPLDVCYRVRIYTIQLTLPNTEDGYIIAFQRCCRIIDIRNLMAPSNSYGATYFSQIPGTKIISDGFKNSSPQYETNDASAICKGSAFTFDFGATDPDKSDSLVYSLCSGFVGASQSNPSPQTTSPPPFSPLNYSSGYAGGSPLGLSVSIDSKTGIVTGVAPQALGQYVITACASEYRQGKLINIHRKDIHIAVSDCIPLNAKLKPNYSFCEDFKVSFRNESLNPSGATYTWNFGDGSPEVTTSTTLGRVEHEYADTGTYKVKLKVVLAGQCIDSTTTNAHVYPGFYAGFTSTGSCLYTPFQFNDTTKTRYGRVSEWSWKFGDATSEDDKSSAKSPSWLYSNLGIKRVELIVQSDKGCIDTVYKEIEVRDIPLMNMAFRDTLICSIDTLRLSATGNGIWSWSPAVNISQTNIPNPLVSPKSTTLYKVSLNENGCINTDSVLVRVVDRVSLFAGADTTICATDSIRFTPRSDALRYTWSPADMVSDANIANPLAGPAVTTTFTVEGRIGKCVARDFITVKAVPYPYVYAGEDTVVCFEDTAQLKGAVTTASYYWAASSALSDTRILNPMAWPRQSTTFTLTAYDTLGCPKPSLDEVLVTVRERILASAGNDTAIVRGQPLMLQGSGAELFEWSPPEKLDNPNSANPTAMLDEDATYILKAFTSEGCFAMDTMNVVVFKTGPDIFVPNAFAPEGKNKILKPVAPGIASFLYFRVYNRWGQLVFQSNSANEGWNGIFGGRLQDAGTFVWMVSGIDYTGRTISKKGTSILIR